MSASHSYYPPSVQIHHSSLVEEGAEIGEGVRIGPFCHIGPHVKLKANVHLISHVSLGGYLTIGERTIVYPFAVLGQPPQDLKYEGEPSQVIIGHDTVIREHVTIQPGTKQDKMLTAVGNHCLLMVGSHVAHDCTLLDHVILANNATLAGHVHLGNHVIVGGISAIQQYVRVGDYAIIGGMSGVEKDVIPYGMVFGDRASLRGLNLVGLKRKGFSPKTIQQLLDVYHRVFEVYKDLPLSERIDKVGAELEDNANVAELLGFIKSSHKRSLCLPKT